MQLMKLYYRLLGRSQGSRPGPFSAAAPRLRSPGRSPRLRDSITMPRSTARPRGRLFHGVSMNLRAIKSVLPALFLFLTLSAATLLHAADGLKPGDHVAVIGDSITEQRLYSLYIEDYLLMCKPQPDLRATQFGWGGETA